MARAQVQGDGVSRRAINEGQTRHRDIGRPLVRIVSDVCQLT